MNEESLRDWLAAVIANALLGQEGTLDCHPAAEAVMEALCLTDTAKREWGLKEQGEDEPGILDTHRASLYKYARDGDEVMTRWVTDWEGDDGCFCGGDDG